MRWSDAARATIAHIHTTLPEAATLAERKAAIDAAYPFGERDYWPYKAWLKARRDYLERYGLEPAHRKPKNQLDLLPRDPVTGRPVI